MSGRGPEIRDRIKEVLLWIVEMLLTVLSFLWEQIRTFTENFLYHMQSSREYRQRFFSMCVLPVSIIYYEIVFSLSTERMIFRSRAWLFTILFSISWGLFLYLFCSLSKRPSVNRRLIKIFLIFSMLPLGIQYFIYRQFRVFYDLKTVLAGGGNAMKNFGPTILRMVFSPGGLFHWFLFMIPWILYYIFGRRVDVARRISGRFRLRVIIGMFIFYLLALFFIVTSRTYRPIYGDKYNFHYSINDFGVLTTLRKEAQHMISGKSSGSFRDLEQEETTVTPTPTPATEAEVTPRKTENRLELNFAGSGEVASNNEIEELNSYVQSVSPTGTNAYTGIFEGKNLIFFSAEAFSPWFVTEELTPTLYRLMHKGIYFSDYYQMAGSGTTGGELQNIFGLQPLEGGDSMLKMLSHNNYFTIGSQLNRLGYYGRAFHNNEYRFYDRVETHNNIGYSDTFLGVGNGMEDYIDESLWPESDMEMMEGTLPTYIDKQPFNVYYMTVSGHSVYTQDQNDMSAKHYARVADLDASEEIKCYIAANLDLEDALAYTVKELETKGIADDTVIVLTTDHFPYGLGDDYLLEELYGHPITNTLERDQNALIIWSGSLESQDPIVVDDPVFSVDILPTLSNLFGTDWDSRLMVGRDVFSEAQPLVFNMEYDWKTDKGTYLYAEDRFIPADGAEEADRAYIDRINTIVGNKLHLNSLLLNNDYFGYLFGKSDSQMSEDEVRRRSMDQFDEEAEETGNWGPDNADPASAEDRSDENLPGTTEEEVYEEPSEYPEEESYEEETAGENGQDG